ncbi:MAG: bifunctional DNA-binding transcriptional regulator/O6-methylguanine-DNA methyltransferase Ada [Acidobacteriota bacterium]|nr:bifunctional DNA-binding transcriptional regulator/O6-methylguanine-DNA methyltransferase Ada [Acidobacteriota bacterium]
MQDLDDSRWRAVLERDHDVDGAFVYAVSTTRIYCTTRCAARRPLRRNVTFFNTAAEARLAGYRACRRCRPDERRPLEPATAAVIELCRRLEQDPNTDVGTFASEVGYNVRHLRRRFDSLIGVSVVDYAQAQRASRVRASLREDTTIVDAIYRAGYGSSRAFYEHGAPRLGMSPRTFRTGGAGERITYTSRRTRLGVVLAAATARGVCAVRIGPDEEALESELSAEFPRAVIERDDEGLRELSECIELAARGQDTTALPLDLAGTAFQLRVWRELLDIPLGTTLTYAQVAERIGAPRAVRAVGSACGANPAALLVPCHRVVRRDGSLGGYRWGLEVKAALLDLESPPTP